MTAIPIFLSVGFITMFGLSFTSVSFVLSGDVRFGVWDVLSNRSGRFLRILCFSDSGNFDSWISLRFIWSCASELGFVGMKFSPLLRMVSVDGGILTSPNMKIVSLRILTFTSPPVFSC